MGRGREDGGRGGAARGRDGGGGRRGRVAGACGGPQLGGDGGGGDDAAAVDDVKRWVRWGAGPRAGQALILGAKARALLAGRFHVTPDDVRRVARRLGLYKVLGGG